MSRDQEGHVAIQWDDVKGNWNRGRKGKLGKYDIFSLHYDALQEKSSVTPYRLQCFLPGIKTNLGLYKTPEEAIIFSDKVLKVWLAGAELTSENTTPEPEKSSLTP